jgi:hypothetical protein
MASSRTTRLDRGGGGVLPPAVLLAVAAGIVGLAIAVDGAAARAINGVGVLCWIVAAGLLVRELRGVRRWRPAALLVVAIVLVLALLVRPSDLFAAAVGFFVAGAIVAASAPDRPLGWALLVPASWLPAHVSLAIGRSILDGGTSIRTDPPPTAVLVPLTMVLAAGVGAILVARWRAGRADPRPTVGHAD